MHRLQAHALSFYSHKHSLFNAKLLFFLTHQSLSLPHPHPHSSPILNLPPASSLSISQSPYPFLTLKFYASLSTFLSLLHYHSLLNTLTPSLTLSCYVQECACKDSNPVKVPHQTVTVVFLSICHKKYPVGH